MVQIETLPVNNDQPNIVNGLLLGTDKFCFIVKAKDSDIIYVIYKHGYYLAKGIGSGLHFKTNFDQSIFLKNILRYKVQITIFTVSNIVSGTLKYFDNYNININGILYNKAVIRMFTFDNADLDSKIFNKSRRLGDSN
jgi:sRNA-binding regulator protein Hfq